MNCVYKEYSFINGTGAIVTAKIIVFLVVGGFFLVQERIYFWLVKEGSPSSPSSEKLATIFEICCMFSLRSVWCLYYSLYIEAFVIHLLPETSQTIIYFLKLSSFYAISLFIINEVDQAESSILKLSRLCSFTGSNLVIMIGSLWGTLLQ